MPKVFGKIPLNDVVFFVAADEQYFNTHAIPLINSIKVHFHHPIHFHLYNPSDYTKKYCESRGISISYEYFDHNLVNPAFQTYQNLILNEEMQRRKSKMLKLGDPLNKLHKELIRTYFACARFVRLYELLTVPTYVIMLDTDSLIRKSFSLLDNTFDIHIWEKQDKKHVSYTQHLASTIFYTGSLSSYKLIKEHAELIKEEIEKDTYYWFLDQETLDIVIQKYKKNPLEKEYVDFDMKEHSFIWCAKGKRKNRIHWINEVKKFHRLL